MVASERSLARIAVEGMNLEVFFDFPDLYDEEKYYFKENWSLLPDNDISNLQGGVWGIPILDVNSGFVSLIRFVRAYQSFREDRLLEGKRIVAKSQ